MYSNNKWPTPQEGDVSNGGFIVRRREQARPARVDNALNQAAKELSTRFDFRGTDTKIAWKGEEAIELTSSTEERVKAAVDVFKEKLIRRDISLKAFDAASRSPSGKTCQGHRHLKEASAGANALRLMSRRISFFLEDVDGQP